MNAYGEYYVGPCKEIRVKPKGNGNQNGLMIDGQAYPLQNSNTYVFTGDMTARIHNDHINGNGMAMGLWWVDITGTIVQNDVVTLPDRLVRVHHKTGLVTELFALQRGYDSLASADGQTFFATSGDTLYRIDATSETETAVGSLSGTDGLGLEFGGATLACFEIVNDRLLPLSTTNGGTLGSAIDLGATDLGTIIFVPAVQDPAVTPNIYE